MHGFYDWWRQLSVAAKVLTNSRH